MTDYRIMDRMADYYYVASRKPPFTDTLYREVCTHRHARPETAARCWIKALRAMVADGRSRRGLRPYVVAVLGRRVRALKRAENQALQAWASLQLSKGEIVSGVECLR